MQIHVVNTGYDGNPGPAEAAFSSSERAIDFVIGRIEARVRHPLDPATASLVRSRLADKGSFEGPAKRVDDPLAYLLDEIGWVGWSLDALDLDPQE